MCDAYCLTKTYQAHKKQENTMYTKDKNRPIESDPEIAQKIALGH